MRADRCRSVTESGGRGVSDILASLPGHGVGAPDHEVVAGLLGGFVLLAGA
jgi:hypothetical protein